MKSLILNTYHSFFLLSLLILLAVSLPLATKLVTQSQDTRSKASNEALVTTNFNFKIAFKGIKPEYINNDSQTYNCFSNLEPLTIELVNTTTGTSDSVKSTTIEPITDEVNNDGDQVFKITILVNSTKFASLNQLNYLRVKSNFSLANRFTQNNQTTTPETDDKSEINLNDSVTVYDFSNYSLLPGDLNQDDLINSLDYLLIKNQTNLNQEITCGQKEDINYDGVVNSVDGTLIKSVLTYQSDELIINQTTTPTPTNIPTITTVLTPTNTPTPTSIPTLIPTNTPTTTTILSGSPSTSNSTSCKSLKGICTTYSKALSDGTKCQVSSYPNITGTVKTGLCTGDSKTVCCTNITTNTTTPTSTLTPTTTNIPTPTKTETGGGDKILLKFAVMADIHDNTSGLKKMLKTTLTDGMELVVLAGDLTHDGTTSQLTAVKNVLDSSGVRYVVTEGNHDMRKGLFDNIFGKGYQSIKINGVKLIVIDNSDYRGLNQSPNEGQKAWIESEVVECKTVICIAIMHMPLNHPTSDHVMGEERTSTAKEAEWLRNLLVGNKIKELETGHIHHFAEYTKNGIKTNLVGPGESSDFSEFTVYNDGSINRTKVYN